MGTVHPDRYWTNSGAQIGDALVLTKPLGSGVLFNANLKNWVSQEAMDACVEALVHLNRNAAEAVRAFDVHAVTDITGFGLAGHALEMAKASNVALKIDAAALPVMQEALEMYRKGMTTGTNASNQSLVADHILFERQISDVQQQILYDPQTSGGLLVAVPAEQAPELVASLKKISTPAAALIGEALPLDGQTHLIIG